MRTTFDFAPLFRSSIGFDRMLDALESASRVPSIDNWPPYDIAKVSEDDYRISMAVAGFSEAELTITAQENSLVITGKPTKEEKERNFLYRGIAGRAFERHFDLADHIRVAGAELNNGLLHVDLVREIPEAMKPRTVAINANTPAKALSQAA